MIAFASYALVAFSAIRIGVCVWLVPYGVDACAHPLQWNQYHSGIQPARFGYANAAIASPGKLQIT
jgi:hypothetical protein